MFTVKFVSDQTTTLVHAATVNSCVRDGKTVVSFAQDNPHALQEFVLADDEFSFHTAYVMNGDGATVSTFRSNCQSVTPQNESAR